VTSANPIIAYWWFHLPNWALATLMYTMLGRVLLGFIFDAASTNYIWRFFVRITDPVVKLVAAVTPKSVPPIGVLLFSVVWLFVARIALLALVTSVGLSPARGVLAP
jgi:YggT family protein